MEENKPVKMMSQEETDKIIKSETNKKQRYITAALLLSGTILAVYLSKGTAFLLASFFSFVMFMELNTIFDANKLERIMGITLFFVYNTIVYFNYELAYSIFPFASFLIYSTYSLYSHDMIKSMKLFFSSIWAIYSMSYVNGIMDIASQFTPIYITSLVAANDGFQYIFGRMFGKHRPFTYVSPNKSIEGYIGGLFVLLIVCLIAGENVFYMIFIVYFLGNIGDLIASCLKRQMNLKDFGNILPGMGGMFDRMDSISIVLPASYFWFKYVGYHPGLIIRCIQHYIFYTDDVC